MKREGAVSLARLADKRAQGIASRRLAEMAVQRSAAVNVLQYEAQKCEPDVVRGFKLIFDDPTMPTATRMDAGKQLMIWARGLPKQWVHDGETLQADTLLSDGRSVQDSISAARELAHLHQQLTDLCARNVHPRDWPDDVRSIAGDIIAAWDAEIEGPKLLDASVSTS